MTHIHRFNDSISFLKKEGKIKFAKDLILILGVNHDRVRSLAKTNGAKLDPKEVIVLKNKFPSVNWDYVVTGEGSMLSTDNPAMVQEPTAIYQSKEWTKAELNKIISGKSILPQQEQMELLVEEVLHLRGRIDRIMEINNESLLTELKGLFKRNK